MGIFFFDKDFAHLDTENELYLFENLGQLGQGLVVGHEQDIMAFGFVKAGELEGELFLSFFPTDPATTAIVTLGIESL